MIANGFIAYDLLKITCALIGVIYNKGNKHRLIEAIFIFWRRLYQKVLVYI